MNRTICMVVILVFSLLLCACGSNPQQEALPESTEKPFVPIDPADLIIIDDDNAEEAPEEAEESPAESGFAATLYKGDDNAEKLLPTDCKLSEQSPQAVVDKLYELGVYSTPITVNSFTVDNYNVARIDMGADFGALVSSTGTAGENIMIGALVNSIISVFNADSVYITVDGGTLETGHNVYDFELGFVE